MAKVAITNLSADELKDLLKSWGELPFRAEQIWKWIYRARVGSFEQMSDLPTSLREVLDKRACLCSLEVRSEMESADGATGKALFSLADGECIEAVDMRRYGRGAGRRTICVSTQAGCAIGCPFCATGQSGLGRNLSSGEIVDQVLYFARKYPSPPVTNIVFMGMGEPLANYNAVIKAIRTLNVPNGFNLGARHMTISTAGMVPGIKRLAKETLQVGLAVSLHAPNDSLRNNLVPLNRKYPIAIVLEASLEYYRMTGRRVSFEYALFAGINDSLRMAKDLAGVLKGQNAHVNLIPANPNAGSAFQGSSPQRVREFKSELIRRGIAATVRESMGADIQAGCGQLRSNRLNPGSGHRALGLGDPAKPMDKRKAVEAKDFLVPQEAEED